MLVAVQWMKHFSAAQSTNISLLWALNYKLFKQPVNEPALRELIYPNPGIQNDEQGDFLGGRFYPSVILNVNGEQVGIIGLTTEDTSTGSRMGENIVLKKQPRDYPRSRR